MISKMATGEKKARGSQPCLARRPHSAAASTAGRISTDKPRTSVKIKERRVKSALESKREQEASDIFPEVPNGKLDPEWGVTKYNQDFGPKKRATPVPVRPASPTRMNNPHPAKPFMTWLHPTRIHKHGRATLPPKEVWKFIQERFYEDYTDTSNTGDAKNEVPITNVAKIEFPGEQKDTQLTTQSAAHFGGISGTKAFLNHRQSSKDIIRDSMKSTKSQVTRAPSPESRAVQATVRGSTLPVFKQWLKVASSKERDVVLRMLQAGYTDTEEVRLKKAVSQVLRPDSAKKVQDWLKLASESERQVVLNVLENVVVATGDMKESQYTPQNYYYASGFGHHRSHTVPVSLGRHQIPHMHGQRQKTKCRHCSSRGERRRRVTMSNDGGLGLVGKKIVAESSKSLSRNWEVNPHLWQNRILKPHTGATLKHAGGVFGQPQKDRGQHFSIHPEWPTA